MKESTPISQAEQICRAVCIRHALSNFLGISSIQLEASHEIRGAVETTDLYQALKALPGEDVDLDHFSDDQRQLLSLALELDEREVLYLLECATGKDDELDHSPL